jgi:acyl carrier protein
MNKSLNLPQQVRQLISRRKRVQLRYLQPHTDLIQELHFDMVDLVDVILELERFFGLTIPDEVPLHTIGDLISYVDAHRSPACPA